MSAAVARSVAARRRPRPAAVVRFMVIWRVPALRLAVLSVFLWQGLDVLTTLAALHQHRSELNPFTAMILGHGGVPAFVAEKLLVAGITVDQMGRVSRRGALAIAVVVTMIMSVVVAGNAL